MEVGKVCRERLAEEERAAEERRVADLAELQAREAAAAAEAARLEEEEQRRMEAENEVMVLPSPHSPIYLIARVPESGLSVFVNTHRIRK